MKRSVRYYLQQFVFFAAGASFFCYAVSFLLDRGFPAGQTGLLLGCSNIAACLLQPVIGSVVDRSRKPILIPMLMGLMAMTACSYICMLLLDPPLPLFIVIYLCASLSYSSLTPLMNAITVCYTSPEDEIKFGVGRGIGSLSYGIFTLVMGYVVLWAGIDCIMWIAVSILLLLILVTGGFLKYAPTIRKEMSPGKNQAGLSLPAFFRKYRRFTVALLGIVFLSMFHSMVENYMISIMENLGGNNSHQGTALFIATVSSVPMFFVIDKIRRKIHVKGMLIFAGAFYVVKSLIFLGAVSVGWIYVGQLLQMFNYAFLASAQVFFADVSVEAADKVKGQAVSGASYTMGCAIGNVLGGFFLENYGVPVMLRAGVAMAVTGLVILLVTLRKNRY